MPTLEPVRIVVVDDNPADRLLAVTALRKAGIDNPVFEAEDGQQLLDLLRGQGDFAGGARGSGRTLVLLDVNMPRMNGLEALAEIKGDPALRRIPVVMLTTSEAEADVARAYELGANAYVSKPVSFSEFLPKMKQIGDYWLDLVVLPT